MSNQNNTKRPSNPFAPPKQNSAPSRFGGLPSSSSSSRFSRFGSRTNRETVEWTIAPMSKEIVGISLAGLGDPLQRLLGTPLNSSLSDPSKFIAALSQDADLFDKVTSVLDEAWAGFDFRGVAMVYPMDENIRRAYSQKLMPVPPPPPAKEENSDDSEEYYEDEDVVATFTDESANQPTLCLRAIDMRFVLNMLARVRANVIIGNTPLALELGFLEQTLLCDDPRIVNIARATGCIEEVWD